MPAISPAYLSAVVYLFRSVEDARLGKRAGGSGFVVAYALPNGHDYLYVVTCRHVLDNGFHVIRVNRRDGKADFIQTRPDEDWVSRPTDDLAVYDFVDSPEMDYGAVSTNDFVGRDYRIGKFELYPGDEVFLFGRFITREGEVRNRPVLRSGIISMLPDENALVKVGDREQLAYLVECRSFGGFSGSPGYTMLAQPRYYIASPEAETKKGMSMSRNLWFLGVDCAHLPFFSPVREEPRDDANRLKNHYAETNSGMAVVIPAWRLKELLDLPEMQMQRDNYVKRVDRETKGATTAIPDASDDAVSTDNNWGN